MVKARGTHEIADFVLDRKSIPRSQINLEGWAYIVARVVEIIPLKYLRGFQTLHALLGQYEILRASRYVEENLINYTLGVEGFSENSQFLYCADILDTAGSSLLDAPKRKQKVEGSEEEKEVLDLAESDLLLISRNGAFYCLHVDWRPRPKEIEGLLNLHYEATNVTLRMIEEVEDLRTELRRAYTAGNEEIGMSILHHFDNAMNETLNDVRAQADHLVLARASVKGCIHRIHR